MVSFVTIDFFKKRILWLLTYMLIPKVVDNSAHPSMYNHKLFVFMKRKKWCFEHSNQGFQ